jgi:outer membrane immunogenic protein
VKKILLGAIATVALSTTAFAADLPARTYTKAPPAPVVAAYDWTGCYIGGHAGGAWSQGWTGASDRSPPAPGGQWDLRYGQNASSWVGGGQAGCNWMSPSRFVLGVEADASATGLNASSRIAPIPTDGSPAGRANTFAFLNRSVDWVGSVRGRLGFAPDRWLLYVTGGWAYGHVNYSADTNFTGAGGAALPAAFSQDKSGWVAGVGVEYAFTQNWIARAEYLYYSFGSANAVGFSTFGGTTVSLYSWNKTDLQVARVGLSYKFGGPVVAKY